MGGTAVFHPQPAPAWALGGTDQEGRHDSRSSILVGTTNLPVVVNQVRDGLAQTAGAEQSCRLSPELGSKAPGTLVLVQPANQSVHVRWGRPSRPIRGSLPEGGACQSGYQARSHGNYLILGVGGAL